MMLLKQISWPDARKHFLRTLLALTGIVIGVGVFIGIHTANQSVLNSFRQTVDRMAGKAQLQISAGEAGFAEELLDRVQALPEVGVAVPVIEAVVNTGLPGEGNLLILGVDMVGDRSLRDYDLETPGEDVVPDPLVFLAQPDSLILTRTFAARNSLRLDSRITMRTMDGERQFVVRGLMKPGGMASAFGGNIAIMDVFAAQKVFGRGRTFDRIELAAKEGVTLGRCREALRKLVGPGFAVEPPSARGERVESLTRVYSMSMGLHSFFALLIGMFIIYSSLLIAVTQRRSEIGILRALGASQSQVVLLFVAEAAIAGLIGSCLGAGLGLVLGKGLVGRFAGIVEGIFGVAERSHEVVIEPGLLLGAIGMGVVTSMVAALIPALSAARVDPVEALRLGSHQTLPPGENRLRRWVAAALGAIALICLLFGRAAPLFYGGYLLSIASFVLLTPSLALWLARVLRPVLGAIRPTEGTLAVDSLIQSPRRTSGTVLALTLSTAMVIAQAGTAVSTYAAIRDWLDTTLNAPLFVSPSENLESRNFHFPASMTPELQQIDGVEEVLPVRDDKIIMNGRTIVVVGTDLVRLGARTPRRRVMAGDFRQMHREAGQGKGVIVADNFAQLQRVRLGSVIEIPAPKGLLRLPIVGILRDLGGAEGLIYVDRSLYEQYWDAESVDQFRIYLRPGASAEAVKRLILDKFAARRRLFVLFGEEAKAYTLSLADQWFGMTYIEIGMAVVVSILGILNVLTVTITERRRELGVLRVVGGMPRQIRVAVWMEALAITAIGLILGCALGAVNLYYQLELIRRDVGGMYLEYQYPFALAALLVPVILAAALLSALAPGEFAVRQPLEEALRYE